VSKGERHTANQRPDVERVIATRGLNVVAEYEEKASAAKTRLVFDRMMADAHRGAFDVLVVWALDRFGRSPLMGTVSHLSRSASRLIDGSLSAVRNETNETPSPSCNLKDRPSMPHPTAFRGDS